MLCSGVYVYSGLLAFLPSRRLDRTVITDKTQLCKMPLMGEVSILFPMIGWLCDDNSDDSDNGRQKEFAA
jgi:hypothetical protein